LLDANRHPYQSAIPGSLGGHRRQRTYGRLTCRAASQAIARGGYVKQRVFFLDERTAKAAGYRPCAVCMPAEYEAWCCEAARLQSGYLTSPKLRGSHQ
jgi:methylphosphotriester-DNA--protein-cysteine methyltransferase